VRGTRFFRGDRIFFMHGMNHWAAPTLARTDDPSGWDRLRRDLDRLQSIGINTLRVMASTEGPNAKRRGIVPAIQPEPHRYDTAGVEGVLRLADEMRHRGLYGIFVLNNFWSWSGGMAQYRAWAEGESIPWYDFGQYAGGFYGNEAARELSYAYVNHLVPQLRDNPAVIWELANEPRRAGPSYATWLGEAAVLVKSLAPLQLLTTGSEGDTAGLGVIDEHRNRAIDFATHHMWAQNWGWVAPATLEADFDGAVAKANAYMGRHALLAAQLGKPIVLEEFGFPRDGGSFDPAAPTVLRDRYFAAVYRMVRALCEAGPMAGVMPWAWAGESRPPRPGGAWAPGDPWTGDPPHEPQGWYSVYDSDSTVAVIREGGDELIALSKA
jgi:mannan endo-1,4-beta-mannosidase